MKYLDKVIKVNEDGENYESGYRLELSNLQIEIILNALEIAEEIDGNSIWKEHQKLKEKFWEMKTLADKGLINREIN